jgi:hypothetical protein
MTASVGPIVDSPAASRPGVARAAIIGAGRRV